jgi:hypothetical protein
VGAAFVESRFVVRRHEIAAELAALTRAAERLQLPDYSNSPMRVAAPYKAPAAEAVVAPVVSPVVLPVVPPAITHQPVAATVVPPAIPEPAPEPTLPPIFNKPLFNKPVISPAPVRQPISVKAVEIPVEIPAEMPTAPSEDGQFRYGGELGKVVVFGKREVPRATRGIKKA